MESSISSTPPVRSDVVSVETTARPTAPKVPFSEVLSGGARALVGGAQSMVNSLPGSPLMALAVRPGSTMLTPSSVSVSPEGPGGAITGTLGGLPGTVGGTGAIAAGSTGTAGNDGISQTLAQDQEMNLYYLQIQEQVNAQNRTYSALSNVIEVEHNTAKTAIGNIH
jgi:hypothetical protein